MKQSRTLPPVRPPRGSRSHSTEPIRGDDSWQDLGERTYIRVASAGVGMGLGIQATQTVFLIVQASVKGTKYWKDEEPNQ